MTSGIWLGVIVALVVIVRVAYVLATVERMCLYTHRQYRKPALPSLIAMTVRFWVWNPYRLTNDQLFGPHLKPPPSTFEHFSRLFPNLLARRLHAKEADLLSRAAIEKARTSAAQRPEGRTNRSGGRDDQP